MKRLILASASPRRRELLRQAGADFEIIPAKGEEIMTKQAPEEVVVELARQKALEVSANLHGNHYVLGADTVVAFAGRILGKPKDEKDAVRMLELLNGNSHFVYTGVAIVDLEEEKQEIYSFYEKTEVRMYPMSREEIAAYVKTGEPMDKAGAYGIQGKCALFIERITGDYNNVVGLPVARIYQETAKLGIEIFSVS